MPNYDVSYFMHSAHAHARPIGCGSSKTLGREQFFTCELGFNDGDCTMALKGANTYLCWLLRHVSMYLGLPEIDAELNQWFAKINTRQNAQNKPVPATP